VRPGRGELGGVELLVVGVVLVLEAPEDVALELEGGEVAVRDCEQRRA